MLAPVLGFLALATPSSDVLPTFTSQAQVAAALAPLGYAMRKESELSPLNRIDHEGVTVDSEIAVKPGDYARSEPDKQIALLLYLDIPASGAPLSGWPPPYAGWLPGTTKPRFVVHLGGSATESAQINLLPGTSRAAVGRALDRFWAEGRAFAKAHEVPFAPAPEYDPRENPLPDSLVLDRADQESFRRAFESWGWTSPETVTYSLGGWSLLINPKHGDVWVCQAVDGTRALRRRVQIKRFDPWSEAPNLGGDPKSTALPPPNLVPWFGGGPALAVVETLDLSKRTTLGELRRRILAFASARPGAGNDR